MPTQQQKRGTAAALAAVNPTPSAGEIVWVSDTNTLVVGNGSSAYSSLSTISATPTSHTHGNITNAGAIGSTANLPLITTTSGVITVGSFGSSASSFCEGNDARLSDTRTPTDGSVSTAKLANDAVTYAKLQNVSATDRLLGRSSAGAGDVEEITCTSFGRSLIDDADAATARTTLSVQPTASPAFTGAATVTSGSIAVSGSVGSAPTNGTAHTCVLTSTATAAVNVGPTIFFQGQTGNNTTQYGFGSIQGVKDSSASQDYAGALVFYAQTGGGSVSQSEVMRCRTNLSTGAVQTVHSGQVFVTAGSKSLCSVAPSGDADTGIFFPAANQMAFSTNDTERMRIDASGNVGIGTQSPTASLHVNGSSFFSGAATFDNDINLATGATQTIYFDGALDFAKNGTGSRLLIDTNGKITAAGVYNNTVGATNRDVFVDSGGVVGYVSSIRASKTDIASLDDVSWLSALTPVSYRYRKRNEDGTYSDEADGVTDYGLIAEDVEQIRPDLCFYDDVDGTPELRGVTYSKLITPMLRYIQQLEARIAALEERLSHA